MNIALLGNPNTGKSTIFNLLTGLRQHIGNFPGVTVDKKIGEFIFEDKKHIITEQINCFPDKNYCYFFNKKYFYDFFYKQDFSLLFSKKNLTDNVNFKNFKNVFEKIEYEDFFFYKKPPEISS